MGGNRFEYIGAKLIPRFRLSENAVSEYPRAVATFLSVANLGDKLDAQSGYPVLEPGLRPVEYQLRRIQHGRMLNVWLRRN